MVHRPPDSRLLTNLINHEKEYSRHLTAVFPQAHAALASLSAYAAGTNPTGTAQSITAVVDALAGADNALQRYTHALDDWRDHLTALKDLEDDLATVLRDRDILVTRLIKASKASHRSSRLLIVPPGGLGSASLATLSSTSTSASTSTLAPSTSAHTSSVSAPASTNTKLAQAQTELQACEAHLIAKERELDARRISVARDGLGARCRALIDCAWVWGEMGKRGLQALEALSDATSVGATGEVQRTASTATVMAALSVSVTKPLPTPTPAQIHQFDDSSLTPSQSASQTVVHSTDTSPSKERSPSEPEPQPITPPKPTTQIQIRTRKEDEGGEAKEPQVADNTIVTVPPSHVINDWKVPTGVRSQSPSRGTSNVNGIATKSTIVPRRNKFRSSRRPSSQHITEVSDEGTEEGASVTASNRPVSIHKTNTDSNANAPTIIRTPYPTPPRALPDATGNNGEEDEGDDEDENMSSEFEHPDGPFQVVENDPFQVIRRSILGSNSPAGSAVGVPDSASSAVAAGLLMPVSPASVLPVAHMSAPDVRQTGNASALAFPTLGSGSETLGRSATMTTTTATPSPSKRPRRTSMALLGSIRGLFRKPTAKANIMDRMAVTEWEDSDAQGGGTWSSNGKAQSGNADKKKQRGRSGWVTRTDARIRGGRKDDDSDVNVEPPTKTAMQTVVANVKRRGTRLRKGRPSPGPRVGVGVNAPPTQNAHDLPSIPARISQDVRVDRWTTDNPASKVKGNVDRSKSMATPGMTRHRKTSVSDLRGSDQGHTDGEAERKVDVMPSTSSIWHGRGRGSNDQRRGRGRTTSAVVPGRRLGAEEPEPTQVPSETNDANAYSPGARSPQGIATTNMSGAGQRPLALSNASTSSRHRRSASLSLLEDMQRTSTTTGTLSWRKPPPTVQYSLPSSSNVLPSVSAPVSRVPSPLPLLPKPNPQTSRRQVVVGNGHVQQVAQGASLMSIVANVTRERDGNSRSMDVPRAPKSVLNGVEEGAESVENETRTMVNGRGGHAKSATSLDNGGHHPVVKMPLRSALRNASRTPSPSPAGSVVAVPQPTMPVKEERDRNGRQVSQRSSWRDSMSVSSYETGRESLDGEGWVESSRILTRSRSLSPPLRAPSFTIPPPPSVDPPTETVADPKRNSKRNTFAVGETASPVPSTSDPPVRRKSVRVSLPPSFSPTPPVMCDEDGEEYAPWTASFSTTERSEKKKKKKREEGEDMWADSSEEEEEVYGRAKRLLSLVGERSSKGKGKARA